MSCFETGTIINLAPRQAITLADARGTTLRVTRGTLWLTQEKDPRDIVLRAGDSWVVERDGATVIESQDDALLCIAVHNGASPDTTVGSARRPSGWLAAAGAWLSAPPRHRVPYA